MTEKLQYDMPEPLRKKLEEGLARLTSSGLAAATAAAACGGSSGAGAGPSSSSSPLGRQPAVLDSDDEDEPDGDAHDNPLSDHANDALRFQTELTGTRSAVQLAWQKCPLWLGLGLP